MDDAGERRALIARLKVLVAEYDLDLDSTDEHNERLGARISAIMARGSEMYLTERRRRYGALTMHAVRACLVGGLIIIGGAPGNIESLGIGMRPLLGYLALIAGAFLLVGPRLYKFGQARLEVLGLVMVGLWDLTFTVALLVAMVNYDAGWSLCWPWQLDQISKDQPRLYTPVIYMFLCTMVWGVHLRAVLGDRRDDRA